MRDWRTAAVWGCALLGCGDALPSPTRVDSLRIFALVTDTPEVLSGEGVTVRAAWFQPSGSMGRFLWRLCPEAPDGDARACARQRTSVELVTTEDALEVGASELVLSPQASSATWVVYVALCTGIDPVYDPALGHARCGSDSAVEAIRRVTVRRAPPLNQVPRIARVLLRAGDRSVDPGVGLAQIDDRPWAFVVEPASDAAEGQETLMVSFYATGGAFDAPRALGVAGGTSSLQTVWHPGAGASLLWCVLRDQRGGESVWRGRVEHR